MVSSVSAVADGTPGVAHIVATLNALAVYYGQIPAVRACAARIIQGTGNHDQAGQINRLAGFVRGALVYVADPLNAEFVQTPDVLLLQINARGFAQGDCDDHCLLFASLAQAIGIPSQIVGVKTSGPVPDHVIVIVQLETGALEFDLCAKGFEQPFYQEKFFA